MQNHDKNISSPWTYALEQKFISRTQYLNIFCSKGDTIVALITQLRYTHKIELKILDKTYIQELDKLA